MPYADLRSYLAALEAQQQLLRVTEQVRPEPDLAAAACAASRLGDDSPALLFENVYGYHTARIAMNVHGSWPNLAIAMDLPKNTPLKSQFFEFVRRYQNYPAKSSSSTAPLAGAGDRAGDQPVRYFAAVSPQPRRRRLLYR
ncbi:Phenolic acid decarboxylase subunit C [Serratia rubidaea]|uniref:Phenolic acid decarboxylase subunit C n=1 Tax=Serratia rubidaea TaxID=61652 RepID=A0A447QNK8_SERRU|nr:Phenolic acid decarboxylase subunit C [Serratia rubidaea]